MTALQPVVCKQQEERRRRTLVKVSLGSTSIFDSNDFSGTPYQFRVEPIDLPAGCTEGVLTDQTRCFAFTAGLQTCACWRSRN